MEQKWVQGNVNGIAQAYNGEFGGSNLFAINLRVAFDYKEKKLVIRSARGYILGDTFEPTDKYVDFEIAAAEKEECTSIGNLPDTLED